MTSTLCLEIISVEYPVSLLESSVFHKTLEHKHNSAKFFAILQQGLLFFQCPVTGSSLPLRPHQKHLNLHYFQNSFFKAIQAFSIMCLKNFLASNHDSIPKLLLQFQVFVTEPLHFLNQNLYQSTSVRILQKHRTNRGDMRQAGNLGRS